MAQHLYTLSALDANPATSAQSIDNAHDALTTGAEARGVLDHSRVQQAEETYKENAEEVNKSLGRSGDWVKLGVGAVVGGGIAALPVPGSTGVAIAIAPVAAETIGNAVSTFIGHQVDKEFDEAEEDPREKAQLTSQQFYEKGAAELGAAYGSYLKENPRMDVASDRADWTQDVKNAYDTGSGQGDTRGLPAYKD
ncbi:hypothetical protein [Streptomyces californicus]